MDEPAFAFLIEPHRRALHLHCYRMLGSLHDAEDALQETMLRAWKGSDRYEPRAQLGTWLHTIATNVCLTALARWRSQPAQLMEDLDHLQPYPDRLLDDLVARETVEFAFITAIQLLPPKQRAVLILRDVLGWSAKEVADALQDSVGAVTSALQRARANLAKGTHRYPSSPRGDERALVKRFMAAWDAVDIDALVALLTEDAVMTMPPERMRIAGARAIGEFFAAVPQQGRLDQIRLVLTAANRQPALAGYARVNGKHRPYGLMVLEIRGDLISGILGFPDPWLFEQCGLPSELD
jgi:RNA polymerase sigma-70 factor (ECF subfamily)